MRTASCALRRDQHTAPLVAPGEQGNSTSISCDQPLRRAVERWSSQWAGRTWSRAKRMEEEAPKLRIDEVLRGQESPVHPSPSSAPDPRGRSAWAVLRGDWPAVVPR
jgi:hypothetical protein